MHLFVKTGQKLASNSRHMIELGALEGSFLFYLGLNLILSTNCNSYSFPIFSHQSNRVLTFLFCFLSHNFVSNFSCKLSYYCSGFNNKSVI